VERPRRVDVGLLSEMEIQPFIFGKQNGITALIVPSKQGLAAAVGDRLLSVLRPLGSGNGGVEWRVGPHAVLMPYFFASA
jgi:hypothetical protein